MAEELRDCANRVVEEFLGEESTSVPSQIEPTIDFFELRLIGSENALPVRFVILNFLYRLAHFTGFRSESSAPELHSVVWPHLERFVRLQEVSVLDDPSSSTDSLPAAAECLARWRVALRPTLYLNAADCFSKGRETEAAIHHLEECGQEFPRTEGLWLKLAKLNLSKPLDPDLQQNVLACLRKEEEIDRLSGRKNAGVERQCANCASQGSCGASGSLRQATGAGRKAGRPQQMQILLRQVQVLPDTWVFLRRGKRHTSIRFRNLDIYSQKKLTVGSSR